MIISTQLKSKLLFMWALLAWFQVISAQKVGLPEIEYYNRRQYGGGTQNWKIDQNENDILYFANNNGLLEFDGVNWRMHNPESTGLVRSVMAEGDRIYAGLFNQLGYFRIDSVKQLEFHPYLANNELHKGGEFWNIHRWNGKIVYHCASNMLIFEDDKLVNVIPTKYRFSSSYLVNGLLLVHDEGEGLMEMRGDRLYKVPGGDIFADKMITSVVSLSEDKIVIGTMTHGLYIWDMNSVSPWEVEGNAILLQSNIFCGANYREQYLVFGTIQSGFVILDKKGRIVMHVDKDKGLVNNTVLSVFVDKEGNIWGGLDNGIVRLSFNSSITFLQGYYDVGTGYTMQKVGDDYYLGTNQALFKIKEKTLHNPLKTRADFHKVTGSEGQVWGLFHDNGQVLCGHNLGIMEISGEKAELVSPPGVKGAWLFRKVPQQPDLMLVGTYGGIAIMRRSGGKWRYQKMVKGFAESSRFMEWDEAGNLWVSHGYEGLFKLRFDSAYESVTEVIRYNFEDLHPDASSYVVVNVKGKCLFVGKQGVFSWNEALDKFERYTLWDQYFDMGFFPDMLKMDDFGNLWYFIDGTVGVLRRMEDGSHKKVDFPFKSIANKLVVSFEMVLVPNKAEAFFGIEDGYAHYFVDELKNYRMPFKVNIRAVESVNDSVEYILYQSDKPVEKQKYVPAYKYKDNGVVIAYAAAYYENDNIEYSTWLKGHDKAYSSWSDRSEREYYNLSEGDYEFLVKARNTYGVQSRPLSFKFTILPPWYKTTMAGVLYVFILIFTTIMLVFIFNKRVEVSRAREKAKQKALYKEKEDALIREALRAEKEVVKMRNEKLQNEMTHKEKELANTTMNIIRKNEFLVSLKEQLKKIKTVKDKAELDNKIQGAIRKIDKDLDSESYWEVFEMHLEQVHDDFLERLRQVHPDLTHRDQKLAAYIRMGMSSKEIASLMNISPRAVENNRYKLRQKIELDQGQNLSRYICDI